MTLRILGDTHLGRVYTNNVPLHRRGEREAMFWKGFEASLKNVKAGDIHVHMGDLFDKDKVDNTTVLRAALAYLSTPEDVTYVVLRGNHDASRVLDAASSFDMFELILRGKKNVHVVRSVLVLDDYVFFGWSPTQSAVELVEAEKLGKATTAFGHWDVDLRSDPFNRIPTLQLAGKGITKAYTGHVHLADTFERDGVEVIITGSLLPLAHGEGGDLFVTVTKADVEADPAKFKDKCVRVVLAEGETWDMDLDCLQIQTQRAEKDEDNSVDVAYDMFDMNKLFSDVFASHKVPESVQEICLKKWKSISSS